MKAPFMRDDVHGLMGNIFGQSHQCELLQHFLQLSHVDIGQWTLFECIDRLIVDRAHQHGCTQHLVIGEHILKRRIAAQDKRGVGQIGHRLAGLAVYPNASLAIAHPIGLRALNFGQFKDFIGHSLTRLFNSAVSK